MRLQNLFYKSALGRRNLTYKQTCLIPPPEHITIHVVVYLMLTAKDKDLVATDCRIPGGYSPGVDSLGVRP